MEKTTKVVIVTIGTSLFSNYQHRDTQDVYKENHIHYDFILGSLNELERLEKDLLQSKNNKSIIYDIEDTQDDIEKVFMSKYFKNIIGESPKIAAELSSLEKIISEESAVGESESEEGAELSSLEKIISEEEEPKTQFIIHLVATDTALSMLAAKLIKQWTELHRPAWDVRFEWPKALPLLAVKDSLFVVKDLRVKAMADYEVGFMNLLEVLQSILKHAPYKGAEFELNITGGYKAIVPIMTLFAQIKGLKLRYLYNEDEGGAELIELGSLPVSLDWGLAERYGLFFQSRKDLSKIIESDEASLGVKNDIITLRKEMTKLYLLSNAGEPTVLGSLFEQFLKQRHGISKDALGFFIEYKLMEYYSMTYFNAKISRSVYIKEETESEKTAIGTELDLLIELESECSVYQHNTTMPSGDFITVEVKALAQYSQKQAHELINNLKKYWTSRPKVIKFVFYSFLPNSYAQMQFNNKARGMGLELARFLNSIEWGDILLEIEHFNIDLIFSEPYALINQLMKERLKPEFFSTPWRFLHGVKQ